MKTKEEILNQEFMTTNDLRIVTGMGINKCIKVMGEIKKDMIENNMFVPYEKKLMLPTKVVRKRLGI